MYKVYLYYPYHTLIPLYDGYNGSRLQSVCVLVRKRYLLISGLSVHPMVDMVRGAILVACSCIVSIYPDLDFRG